MENFKLTIRTTTHFLLSDNGLLYKTRYYGEHICTFRPSLKGTLSSVLSSIEWSPTTRISPSFLGTPYDL